MSPLPPPIAGQGVEDPVAKAKRELAEAEAAAAVSESGTDEQEAASKVVEDPKDAQIAELTQRLEQAGLATGPETPEQKIQRLESQLRQYTGTAGSGVAPLSVALHYKDAGIGLASIEPGIIWGVRHGILKAEDVGQHLVDMLNELDGSTK